jgi:agmatine/peptidylarginine deiminase
MSEKDAARIIAKKPHVLPEYELTEKVILGMDLVSDFGFHNTDLPKSILDAGADILIIGSEMSSDGLDSQIFKQFSEKMASYKTRIDVLSSDMAMFPSTWARDWAPITAKANDQRPVLLDFNYYNERPTDDYAPTLIALKNKEVERLSVPLYLEGGNLLATADGMCLTTERTIEANSALPKAYIVDENGMVLGEEGSAPVLEKQKVVHGYRFFDRYGIPKIRTDEISLTRAEVVDLLQKSAGCKRVVIVPKMPYETTGHIDMWAKALSDKIMLVSAMDSEVINRLKDKKLKSVATEVANYLDQRAEELSDLGFEVVRIPMPMPHFKNGSSVESGKEEYGFRSYTNALILSTHQGRSILVPHYEKGRSTQARGSEEKNFPYPDQDQLKAMELKVTATYSKFGFKVISVQADELLAYGGAIHCATMQLPALK